MWRDCDWQYHLVCWWLWMLQLVTMHTLPRTNNNILQLTWVWLVVAVYKIYCSNIECPIIRGLLITREYIFLDNYDLYSRVSSWILFKQCYIKINLNARHYFFYNASWIFFVSFLLKIFILLILRQAANIYTYHDLK